MCGAYSDFFSSCRFFLCRTPVSLFLHALCVSLSRPVCLCIATVSVGEKAHSRDEKTHKERERRETRDPLRRRAEMRRRRQEDRREKRHEGERVREGVCLCLCVFRGVLVSVFKGFCACVCVCGCECVPGVYVCFVSVCVFSKMRVKSETTRREFYQLTGNYCF